jgi:Holliday junction resolvase-like predicted endonuclease
MRIWLVVVFAVLLGLCVGAWLSAWQRMRHERRLGQHRNARGHEGELHAHTLLTQAGYQIVARQERMSYRMAADTRELAVGLICDFIVAREGQLLVAEVKTGAMSTRLTHPETRRQLLEYQLASGAQSVLLVDPEAGQITEVRFPALLIEHDASPSATAPLVYEPESPALAHVDYYVDECERPPGWGRLTALMVISVCLASAVAWAARTLGHH